MAVRNSTAILVALDWDDVEWAPEGLVIAIRRGKTNPEGRGRRIAVPTAAGCARCARWAPGRMSR